MSRGPHFSSNEKAERELGYETVPLDDAIQKRGLVSRPGVQRRSSGRPPAADMDYGA